METPQPITNAAPAQPAPKLEVKIKLDFGTETADIKILGRAGVALPHGELIRDCMAVAKRKYIRPRDWHYAVSADRVQRLVYSSSTAGKIDLQTWAQAILDALVRADKSKDEGHAVVGHDDEMVRSLSADAPAYFLAGTMVYRVVAESKLDSTNLLKTMVKRNQEACRKERENMMAQANADASMLVRDAQQRKAEVDEEIRAYRAEMATMVPPWVTCPVRRSVLMGSGWWEAGLWISYAPNEFTYNSGGQIYKWQAKAAPPVPILWWLPVSFQDGKFRFASGAVDGNCPELTHTSRTGTCAGPEGLPKKITRMRDLEEIRLIAARVFSAINLNSPLRDILQPAYTNAQVRASIPDELLKGVSEAVAAAKAKKKELDEELAKKHVPRPSMAEPVMVTDDISIESETEEANQTWSTF